MGGCILRHSDWDWRELILCRSDDPDRAPRSHDAADALGAIGRISDLDDSPVLAPLSPDLHEITDRIWSLRDLQYDLIFTHGPAGEYTYHPRHQQVHNAVRRLAESGELQGDLLCFSYDDMGGSRTPIPSDSAEIVLHLTDAELARKRSIIRDIYNFDEKSFEFKSAGPLEGFQVCLGRSGMNLGDLLENGTRNGGLQR